MTARQKQAVQTLTFAANVKVDKQPDGADHDGPTKRRTNEDQNMVPHMDRVILVSKQFAE